MQLFLVDYYYIFVILVLICLFSFITYSTFYNDNFFDVRINIKMHFLGVRFFGSVFRSFLVLIYICFFFIGYYLFNGFFLYDRLSSISVILYQNIFFIAKFFIIFLTVFFFILLQRYTFIFKWVEFEMLILFSVVIFTLSNLIFSKDLFNFFLCLELYGITMSAIIGLRKVSRFSLEAAFKYFILSAISSSFVLFAISIFYMFSGLFRFSQLRLFFWFWTSYFHMNYYVLFIAVILFSLGFCIKLGLAPFNFWLADIYEGAPFIVTFFLLTLTKFGFIFFLIKFYLYVISVLDFIWLPFLFYLIIFSNFLNNFIALSQIKFKKLLIFSSLGNIPFFLLPLYLKSFFSIIAFFSFFIIYFFNLFAIFIITLFSINYINKKIFIVKKIVFFLNYIRINKFFAYIFISFLFSLAGLPPFSGFFGKIYFFFLMAEAGSINLLLILLFINLTLVYYYLRVIKIVLQTSFKYKLLFFNNYYLLVLILSVLFLLNLFCFFFFDFIFKFMFVFCVSFSYILL